MASTSVVFDILARDRASDKFDHLANSADGTTTKMSKLTGVMKTAGKAAAYGLGAGLVVAGGAAVKFAQAAADDQQQAELLKGALERNADATAGQVAAVETWITAQGRAKGVADDDLRPALSRLVTATHDVGDAQRLATLAMDVSAGSGKSLESVSTALMKAQNGQVSALSRLGINTKNAAGETITMAEATKRMSDQFGGAAAEKANTMQGKMDRLKLILSETGEAIGYKLLPFALKLANWFLNDGIPLAQKASNKFQEWWPTIKKVGEVIGEVIVVGAKFTAWLAQKLWPAISTTVEFFIDGGKKAYHFGQAFVDIIQNIAQFVGAVKEKIGNAIGYVKELPDKAKAALGNIGSALIHAGEELIQGLIDGIWDKVNDLKGVLSKVTNLIPDWKGPEDKDKILLKPAGVAIMQGLVDGIEKGKVKLQTVLEKLTDYISKHKEKLAKLQDMKSAIVDAFQGFTSSIFGADTGEQAHADRLKQINDLLAEQADIRQQLADGTIDQLEAQKKLDAAQAKISGLQAEEASQPRGLAALLAFQQQQRAKAEGLKADVGTLISKGISKDLLTQLQNAGEVGEEQIHLLATGTVDQIAQANADNAATLQALQDAGLAAAKAQGLDEQIKAEERAVKQAEIIKGALKELLDEQDRNTVVELHLDGHRILWSLKKIKKQNGGHLGLGDKDPD